MIFSSINPCISGKSNYAKGLFSIFLILTFHLYSSAEEPLFNEFAQCTPEQIASLRTEPSFLIGGVINPLSGQLSLNEVDMVAKGAQEIALSRTYIAPQIPSEFPCENKIKKMARRSLYQFLLENYKGWQFLTHLRLRYSPHSREVLISDPSGMTLNYRVNPNNKKLELLSGAYGLTNTTGDIPNGSFDPRNIGCEFNGTDRITILTSEGFTRHYYKKRMYSTTEQLFLLDKEILPNGKVLKYHYTASGHPEMIESLDPQEKVVYASIKIKGNPISGSCQFISSNELLTSYHYEQKTELLTIKEKVKYWLFEDSFEAEYNLKSPPLLSIVNSPLFQGESLNYNDQFILDAYSGRKQVFKAIYEPVGKHPQHYRVHKLLLPVGKNDAYEEVCQIFYHPPIVGEKDGQTIVKNSDGTSIIYHFSRNLLITSIQYFDLNNELRKEKLYQWNPKSWLKSIEVKDGKGQLHTKKTFEYDGFGNPILELFWGNLSGKGEIETYETRRIFSQDGRHLLLEECTEDGKTIKYSYLPKTNLITSKLVKNQDRILLREFYLYDNCNNLVQIIIDDGSSSDHKDLSEITQRRVTTYTLRQTSPFLHMPESMEETYLEDGQEQLLKKVLFNYDQYGNISEESIFDANGEPAYTLSKEYDSRGNLLSETNTRGQQATYAYDHRGRLEKIHNFSNRLEKNIQYDLRGRPINITEMGDDGLSRISESNYDAQDRLIIKNDHFGNKTFYQYDLVTNQVTKTQFPLIDLFDGHKVEVSNQSTYDLFGRQCTRTDANGNTTYYTYNAYGSPSRITRSNGTQENFSYDKNGQLISYKNAEGYITLFENDILGRVLSKTYLSPSRDYLAKESFVYSAFNVLSETDKEGHLKQYLYDGAGRKIQEDLSGHITEFSYDPIGNLTTITQHNEENTLITHFQKDFDGRILQETKTDHLGNLLFKVNYEYDRDGNQIAIIRHSDQEIIEQIEFDSFSRRIKQIDPEGHITQTVYDENYVNWNNQKVLQVKTIDPCNRVKETVYDALGLISIKRTLDENDRPISSQKMCYDRNGNLTHIKDYLYHGNSYQTLQIIAYTYTPDNQVASLTRDFGSPDERTTTYTYFPSCKLATKVLPNGVTLNYEYDDFGFLKELASSDNSIQHLFKYDTLGNLQSATDEINNIAIYRENDSFGNALSEELDSRHKIFKEYDHFNRLLSLQLPDGSKITYDYNPLFLKKVTKLSSEGEVLYWHRYDEYDLSGNLLTETTACGLETAHIFTPSGYTAALKSPLFTQECRYDALGNITELTENGATLTYSYDPLSQLILENMPQATMHYSYDSLNNRTRKNSELINYNDLNEQQSTNQTQCSYDLNGNLIQKKTASQQLNLTYDALDRLVKAVTEDEVLYFTYDPLGRRIHKAVTQKDGLSASKSEYYLYDGLNEIGSYTYSHESLTTLRILGLGVSSPTPKTIAIEFNGKAFASQLDIQGNVRQLIDIEDKTLTEAYSFTAFGEEPHNTRHSNPWRYASKRFDQELGLIYFGKRYYDPDLGHWLTKDPAGFIDSTNLYQYALNNPYKYQDPYGENLAGFLCGIGQMVVGGALLASGAAIEIATLGGYSIGFAVQAQAGIALMASGCAMATYHARDISLPKSASFNPSALTYGQEYISNGLISIPINTEFNLSYSLDYTLEKRSSHPDPDPAAEGTPHTTIEQPGLKGQYTTHNGDGTFKQYRGSGKPHGNIPRPNIKENKLEFGKGQTHPGKPKVRSPTPSEYPKGN